MFACNGILFNHESKRRGETFVTRKITRGISRILLGLDNCLFLGNLDSLDILEGDSYKQFEAIRQYIQSVSASAK